MKREVTRNPLNFYEMPEIEHCVKERKIKEVENNVEHIDEPRIIRHKTFKNRSMKITYSFYFSFVGIS